VTPTTEDGIDSSRRAQLGMLPLVLRGNLQRFINAVGAVEFYRRFPHLKEKSSRANDLDFSTMTRDSDPAISAGGRIDGIYRDREGGKWLVRETPQGAAWSEKLASRFYQFAGCKTPEYRLVRDGDQTHIASRWLESMTDDFNTLLDPQASKANGVYAGFGVDLLLGHRNVVGQDFGHIGYKNGKAWRLNMRGALLYNEKGERKPPDKFGPEVIELYSMSNPNACRETADVFSRMSREELVSAVRQMLEAISEDDIRLLLRTDGPTDATLQDELIATLIARRRWLQEKFVELRPNPPEPLPAPIRMESDFVRTPKVQRLIQEINQEELTGIAAIRAVMETFPSDPDDDNYPLGHGSADGGIMVFEPRIPKGLPVTNRDGNWLIYDKGYVWASTRFEVPIFCATLRALAMGHPSGGNTGWRNIRSNDGSIVDFAFGVDLPVVVKALLSEEKGYIYVFLKQYFHSDPNTPGEYICDKPTHWLMRIAVSARDLYPSPYLLPYTTVNPDAPFYRGDGPQGELSNETAVFKRPTDVPAELHGVDFEPWQAPDTLAAWRAIDGQYTEIDEAYPYDARADKTDAVATVLLEQDGRFWVVARKGPHGQDEYSLPEGLVEHGLSQQASAIKRANELLGLKAHLLDVAGDYDNEKNRTRVYIARRTGGTIAKRLAAGELLLVPFAKASELLTDARDQDILADVKEKVFPSL